MGRFLFLLGLGLILLPFVVLGVEFAIAAVTHPTGEAAMAVGFWFVWTAFVTVIPGIAILLIGVILWFMER